MLPEIQALIAFGVVDWDLVTRVFRRIQIDPNGCWKITPTKSTLSKTNFKARRSLNINGVVELAHRVAYMAVHGRDSLSDDRICVCHKCDVGDCVNPDHLFLGTQKDNIRDCFGKGRGNRARGSQAGHAKVTEAQVRAIRRSLSNSISASQTARDFGISRSIVKSIKAGRTWGWLDAGAAPTEPPAAPQQVEPTLGCLSEQQHAGEA